MAVIILDNYKVNLTAPLSASATTLQLSAADCSALCATLGNNSTYLTITDPVSTETVLASCAACNITIVRGAGATAHPSGACVTGAITSQAITALVCDLACVKQVNVTSPLTGNNVTGPLGIDLAALCTLLDPCLAAKYLTTMDIIAGAGIAVSVNSTTGQVTLSATGSGGGGGGGGGGTATPVGPAGGALSGSYPNPGLNATAVLAALASAPAGGPLVPGSSVVLGADGQTHLLPAYPATGGGGGPATPTGPAGGALTGTYPNPGLAPGAAASNIGTLSGALTGALPNPGLNPLEIANAIGSSPAAQAAIATALADDFNNDTGPYIHAKFVAGNGSTGLDFAVAASTAAGNFNIQRWNGSAWITTNILTDLGVGPTSNTHAGISNPGTLGASIVPGLFRVLQPASGLKTTPEYVTGAADSSNGE